MTSPLIKSPHSSIDLTRMECKVRDVRENSMRMGIDLTRMECKVGKVLSAETKSVEYRFNQNGM